MPNVTTKITGSVRQLCLAAEQTCRSLGYAPVMTSQLSCTARDAGVFLADIARCHAGTETPLAFLAGGETVVHLTGKGLGGRNQELALAAAQGIAGLNACVFSFGLTERTAPPMLPGAMQTATPGKTWKGKISTSARSSRKTMPTTPWKPAVV